MCLNCLKDLKKEQKDMEALVDRIHAAKADAKAKGLYEGGIKKEIQDISELAHKRLNEISPLITDYLKLMN